VLETLGLGDQVPPPPEPGQPRQAFQDVEVGTGIWKDIADVIASKPRDHWLHLFGEEVNVPIGPVLSVEEATSHPHVRGLGLMDDAGYLRNLVRVERATDTPPPAPMERNAPLEGLKVLEVTGYIAGSYVGRLLADLGADVVKIEAPTGDPFRRGDGNGPSLGFVSWNYGKRGMALDLSSEEGKTKVMAMAERADIFVTNYRANSLKKLGLSREELFAVNPGLIHCVISAFGEGGPLSHLQGFDPIVQAFSGVQKRQGGSAEPIKSQMAATDYMSAMLGALGVIAARTRQVQDGGGYTVSTSLLNGALLLVYDAITDLREGREYSKGAVDYTGPHTLEAVHQASDGWLFVTVEDRDHPAYADARAYLDAGVTGETVAEVIEQLAGMGVTALPCIHPIDLREHEHFTQNKLFFELAQPEHGTVILPSPPLRMHPLERCAPVFGEEPSLADWGL
jgi:crotonobetainyl-CoA:carnitine CoA-transferase CaiB-like acyl-CoA transferase